MAEPLFHNSRLADSVAPPANVIADAVDQLDHKLDRVAYAAQLLHAAETWTAMYVDWARADGHTWAQIGAALGVSKQAAQQRYGGG